MKLNIIHLIILVLVIIITFNYLSNIKSNISIQNKYDIETPTIRPMYIYPGGPFSKNDRCNVFPENPNLIMWNNAKLWGVPLAPPFPKYPWPPSL